MEKEFVPYELAVKLKALGFEGSSLAYYESNGEMFADLKVYHSKYIVKGTACLAPLWQQAFDFTMDILTVQPGYYQTHIIYVSNNMITVKTDTGRQSGKLFHSRIKCLEYLIELVTKKDL